MAVNAKISAILAVLMLLPLSDLWASPISDQGSAGGNAAGSSQSGPVNDRSLLDVVPTGIEGAPISDGIDLPQSPQTGSHAAPAADALHPSALFGFSGDSPFPSSEPLTEDGAGFQDPNLKQVLRAIATVHRSDAGDAQSRQSSVEIPGMQPGDFSDGQDDLGLSHIILDSPTAANVLRNIIDIKSATDHGTVFSIFGMGQFMLETMPGTHVITLSELSTGQSVTVLSSSDGSGQQNSYNQNTGDANENTAPIGENSSPVRRLVIRIVDFATSPLAILLAMIVVVILALRGTVRTIASLRTQAALMRHQQPSTRRSRSRGQSKVARRGYPSRQLRPPAQ